MLKFADAGKKLLQLCLTKGEVGTYGDPQLRAEELKTACRMIPCDLLQYDFPDTALENTVETRQAVAKVIRKYRPRVVFAPYHSNTRAEFGGVAHRDHMVCGEIVRDAIKLARIEKAVPGEPKHQVQKSYFFMLPRSVLPQLYVDVSDVIDRMLEIFRAHESQMAIRIAGRPIDEVALLHRAGHGLDIGAKYAEAFVCDLPLKMTAQTFLDV